MGAKIVHGKFLFLLVDHLVFQNPALAIAKPLFLTT